MLIEFAKALLGLILLTLLQIVLVGCLWVLRVAVDWWLDVDYVEKIRHMIKKNGGKQNDGKISSN